ncbi:MAG: APC family permease [Sulfurospirillum sp.]
MKKSFGLWSAIFLGIGSMVGAGIFVLLGESGAIAGNLVWVSFILGGIIALSAGYSLAKLAGAYPSRGGIVEYLVQCYGEGIFSGSVSILFYLSAIVGIAMVAKTFGVYAAHMFGESSQFFVNLYSIVIVLIFVFINLAGSSLIAKSENIIVITKLSIIIFFTIIVFFYIKPEFLSFKDAPALNNVFFAISLTFFAYAGFNVIANTAEDMDNPKKTMMKAMIYSILIVMVLYIAVVFAVFGNLPLKEIIKAQDYALAEAAKPVFGKIGFTIMAVAALISTSSSINANLYATTNITYQMAKDGDLPKVYERSICHSSEGLIVSAVLLIVMILFFKLNEIATIGSIYILFIHVFVHTGHLFRVDKTGANRAVLLFSIITLIATIVLAFIYTSKHVENIGYYIIGGFILSYALEMILRLATKRVVQKQIRENNHESDNQGY